MQQVSPKDVIELGEVGRKQS